MVVTPMSQAPAGRGWKWWALLAVTVAAVALVAIPIYGLRPFAPQTPTILARAYALRWAAPVATVIALLVAMALDWSLWRGARWMGRIGMVLSLALIGATAWLSRQNIFEWMFKPLPKPGYVAASAASFVAADERVLAIEVGGDAVAYPIRQLSYHHVVLDTVGGTPIVATY